MYIKLHLTIEISIYFFHMDIVPQLLLMSLIHNEDFVVLTAMKEVYIEFFHMFVANMDLFASFYMEA